MRTPSLRPDLSPLLFAVAFVAALQSGFPAGMGPGCDAAAAQSAPPGGVTSEDLFDEPAAARPNEPPPPDPLALQEADAERAFADGDLPRAIELYRGLGTSHPVASERSRLRVTAAWLLFQQGNLDGASRELAATLFQDPGFVPRAEVYSPEFMALFQNAQRDATLDRERVAALQLKQGVDALAAGNTAAARGLLEASLALSPASPRALFGLAQVDLREQRIDAALAGFEKVLALERGAPANFPRQLKAQALNNVGVIYFGRSQYEDASHALEEAARLNSGDARVWFNLGLARRKLGLDGPGLEALRKAHELDRKDGEIASELGRAYTGAGRWMEAVAVLLEGTQAHPESALLWVEFAEAQRGLGNLSGMAASLSRAIELDPVNAQGVGHRAAMELAQSALNAKNFGQAVSASEAAVRLKPADGSAWALLGLSQQASGRLEEAAGSLEKAAAIAPDRADIAHNLGTVYLAQRRYPEAEATFRRAVALDPAATESAAALARMQAQKAPPGSGGSAQRQAARPAPPVRKELGAKLSAVDYPPLGIRGLLVESVVAGGLAELSGLLVDDLILRADGRPVTQAATLTSLLASSRSPSVDLSVLRAGKPVTLALRNR
jgi:tetratricopeptide (TPR) repeat protein